MVFLTWIRDGLAEALWPGKLAGDKKRAFRWSWAVHLAAVALILGVLVYINNAWDLERSLRSPWPGLHRAWLPLLFALSYVVMWLLFCLSKLLASDTRAGLFPDIDEAWSEALLGLRSAGIDLQTTPVYLVLGRPAASEEMFFEAAGTLLLQARRRKEAPLHVYARSEGIFVTCTGASLLGRQVNHLLESDIDTGLCWSEKSGSAEVEHDHLRASTLGRESLDLYLARLHLLARLLARARGNSCPIDGLLIVIPLAVSNNAEESTLTGRLCQQDLLTLRAALGVDCPIYVTVCDLEKIPGWSEFAMSLSPDQTLACRFPLLPDLELAEIEDMVGSGIRNLMQVRLSAYGNAMFRLEGEHGEAEKSTRSASRNERLVAFLSQMHVRTERLVRLVTSALYSTTGWYPMVGGFYLAATDGQQNQRHAAELFKDMARSQSCVVWTSAALAEERRYRHLARGIIAGALLLGAVLLACSFVFLS